jgi:hypothetical protein
MIGRIVSFVQKSDCFAGSWNGEASAAQDPDRNRIELLRFAGILLGDKGKSIVAADEIVDCIRDELNVELSTGERAALLNCLEHHPAFVRSADKFQIV